MQLTLSTTFVQPSVAAGPALQRGSIPQPSREAVALSQLDRIAAQNLRNPAHGLGGAGMLLALLGGLVVLGSASMWRGTPGDEPRPTMLAERQPAPEAVAPVTRAEPTPAALTPRAAVPTVTGAPESMPTAVAALEPAAAEAVAVDEAARKARAKQLADARRKAAQLAQERASAEETQRLQLAQQQQRDAEQAQRELAEQARQRAAAEKARAQHPVHLVLDSHRSVGESCSAAGSLVSRQFCRSRECGKPEHQSDPVCVRLREDQLAQQRASNDR